jgi:hypothetical protein
LWAEKHEAYTPFKDLSVGDFVLVRPHNPNLIPLLIRKLKGDDIKEEESEYFEMVKVQ